MSFFRKKPKEPELPPEWMIVGLGNPGPEYRGTRHNVGFDVLDLLAQQKRVRLTERKHRANYGQTIIGGTPVLLVKPMTFMNLSGQAVAALGRAYGIAPEKIIVVSDEVHLPVGQLRLRKKGSAGGHNGHKSVISSLGTDEYPRLRIGVGEPPPGEQIDHVLSGFSKKDREIVDESIYSAAEAIRTILENGIDAAMGAVNKRQSGTDD